MIEKLKQARSLIERGWCRGAYARDVESESVDIASPRACSWCLDGALKAVSVDYETNKIVNRFTDGMGLWAFNDAVAKGKEDVLAILDRAIAYATLTAVEDVLSRGWCQKDLARDDEGNGCSIDDPRACSYCLVGAFLLVGSGPEPMNLLRSEVGPSLCDYNNSLESVEPIIKAINTVKEKLCSSL